MKTSARAALVAVTVSALLVACGDKPAEQQKVLNVYNWSDYIDESVITDFEKETGIDVTYDVFDSNEVLETKLLAGSTGYDIVVPSASFLERQIKAGVFQKLDKSKLPNLQNMDPELMAKVALHDPNNEHSVNHLWGTSGVGYNIDKINERMKDAPVDSFAMFYDPKVVSKFADCGVSILDAPSEVLGTVLVYLGKDPNSENPEDLAAAEKALLAIRPYVRYVHSSKYIDDLANGEICLTLGWSGDIYQAAGNASDANNGVKIDYKLPREGAIMFFDMLAIPKDAKNVENAHAFINYLMRPEVAAKNTNYVSYASFNIPAKEFVNKDILENPAIYPSDEVKTRLQVDLAESDAFTQQPRAVAAGFLSLEGVSWPKESLTAITSTFGSRVSQNVLVTSSPSTTCP
jgi:putrescine transport system substrate-binding protein